MGKIPSEARKIILSHLRRFNTQEYAKMYETGILRVDERVELMGGMIVIIPPISSLHAATVNKLNQLFSQKITDQRVFISVHIPVHLDHYSEPVPDLALVSGEKDDYVNERPIPPNILLLIEVVDAKAAIRNHRISLYAGAGIRELWIINLVRGMISSYQVPNQTGYQSIRSYTGNQFVSPVALPGFRVRMAELTSHISVWLDGGF